MALIPHGLQRTAKVMGPIGFFVGLGLPSHGGAHGLIDGPWATKNGQSHGTTIQSPIEVVVINLNI